MSMIQLVGATLHPSIETIPDDAPLNPEQIAEILGMNTESVRRWCRTGQLKNMNFGNKYVVMGSYFKEFCLKHTSKTELQRALNDS